MESKFWERDRASRRRGFVFNAVGYRQSKVNMHTFCSICGRKTVLVVTTHVDNCAIAGRTQDINDFQSTIKKMLTIKKLADSTSI
jgi:hypothetical protein